MMMMTGCGGHDNADHNIDDHNGDDDADDGDDFDNGVDNYEYVDDDD